MSVLQPVLEASPPVPAPTLLVELAPRSQVFFENLGDLIFPRPVPPLELQSTAAEFWPDVLVERRLPWRALLQSVAYHGIAIALLAGLTHLFALHVRTASPLPFDRSQVVYYHSSEYLPPLDTRVAAPSSAQKAAPAFSRQSVISVPPEADNHSQTIVTPPRVKLQHNLALPNMVAWSSDQQKPRLAVPSPPLVPASEITRIAPSKLENSVVLPPPDADRLSHSRSQETLQSAVVAPPPELQDAARPTLLASPPDLIAPPPEVASSIAHRVGNLTVAPSAVIGPAPKLPLAEQRSLAGGGSRVNDRAVVPPPPALSGVRPSPSAGEPGNHVVALSLNPAVRAPAQAPGGNRRGSFAATPEGKSGASGSPGSTNARSLDSGSGAGSARKMDLPTGLYVGSAAKPSPVAGNSGNTNVAPELVARNAVPRASAKAHPIQPADPSKLSPSERSVFAGRRFYSLTLNMPNLNSAGGSWVIRFAELDRDSGDSVGQIGQKSTAADLSQPMATRKVDPAYPMQLMRENVTGTVIVYAVIHVDGSVGNVRVLRGVDDRIDRFASDAVAQWKFEPATKNGAPVDVEATFQIPFRPARLGSNF